MMFERTRSAASYAGWLAACLAFVALSGFLLFGPNDALAQSAAIDAGEAETVPARLHAELDTNERTDRYGRVHDGPDEWQGELSTEGARGERTASFDPRGKGEILHKWEGATVTCYLWEGWKVIGIRLPDGTVVKEARIGWYGAANRWAAGVGALGIALLMGWSALRLGRLAGLAGGVLLAGAVGVMLHLHWLWVALLVDLVVVLTTGLYVFFRPSAPRGVRGGQQSEPS